MPPDLPLWRPPPRPRDLPLPLRRPPASPAVPPRRCSPPPSSSPSPSPSSCSRLGGTLVAALEDRRGGWLDGCDECYGCDECDGPLCMPPGAVAPMGGWVWPAEPAPRGTDSEPEPALWASLGEAPGWDARAGTECACDKPCQLDVVPPLLLLVLVPGVAAAGATVCMSGSTGVLRFEALPFGLVFPLELSGESVPTEPAIVSLSALALR